MSELLNVLIGGLGQQPRPGGLGAMQPQPMQPSTATIPDSQALSLAQEALPSLREAARVARERYAGALEPADYESQFSDALLGVQDAMGRGVNFARPGEFWKLGLAANTGVRAGQEAWKERELEKARLNEQMAQKAFETGERRVLDAEFRKRLGGGGTGKYVPSGTPGLMINNVTGAQLDLRNESNKRWVADFIGKYGDRYASDQDAMQAAYLALENNGAPTATSRAPQPTAPAADVVSSTTPENLPKFKLDTSRMSPEAKDVVQRLITRYDANPSEELAAKTAEMLRRILLQEQAPPVSTAPLRKDKVAEAREKKLAERTVEQATERKIQSEREIGKAEGVIAGDRPADINALRATGLKLDEWAQTAKEALEHPGLSKVVGAAGYIPGVGRVATVSGTDAANFKALMTPLLAKTAFAELQAMRDASKTGGALGAITEKELDRLENSISALSYEQDPAQFKKQLQTTLSHISALRKQISDAYTTKHGSPKFHIERADQTAPTGGRRILSIERVQSGGGDGK